MTKQVRLKWISTKRNLSTTVIPVYGDDLFKKMLYRWDIPEVDEILVFYLEVVKRLEKILLVRPSPLEEVSYSWERKVVINVGELCEAVEQCRTRFPEVISVYSHLPRKLKKQYQTAINMICYYYVKVADVYNYVIDICNLQKCSKLKIDSRYNKKIKKGKKWFTETNWYPEDEIDFEEINKPFRYMTIQGIDPCSNNEIRLISPEFTLPLTTRNKFVQAVNRGTLPDKLKNVLLQLKIVYTNFKDYNSTSNIVKDEKYKKTIESINILHELLANFSSYLLYSRTPLFKFMRIENSVIRKIKSIFFQLLDNNTTEKEEIIKLLKDINTDFNNIVNLTDIDPKISEKSIVVPETIKIFNNGKDLNGSVEEYYNNGKLKFKAGYVNGKLDGEVLQYYEDGSEKSISNCKNGYLHGKYKVPAKEDNVVVECNYYYGMIHGKELKSASEYKTMSILKYGLLEGEVNVSTLDGVCFHTQNFKHSILHGDSILREESGENSGRIHSITEYDNGSRVGSSNFINGTPS